MGSPITILLADDHRIMRQGLRSLLEKQGNMKVLAEAADGRAVVELARKFKPRVVIMDISMPELNGVEATRQIIAESANVGVIALSMHADRRFVAEMLEAGAAGYLLKDCAFDELAGAIKAVASGQTYLSPAVAGLVVSDYLRRVGGPRSARLTGREREVLQLLTEGANTKQTAMALKVSPKTIETHRRRIMRKLNLYSVAELTKWAVCEGITSLEPARRRP